MPHKTHTNRGRRARSKGECIRIVTLEVACMAADVEDVKTSLFNPDSTQPSWYYDHSISLGPVKVSDREPSESEDARAREALDVET